MSDDQFQDGEGYAQFELSDDDGQTWRAATKQEYVTAERSHGFNNTLGEAREPATASWTRDGWAGRMWPLTKPGVQVVTFADVSLHPAGTDRHHPNP